MAFLKVNSGIKGGNTDEKYKTPLFDVLDLDAKIVLNEVIGESQNVDFGNEDGVEIPV